ncbi:permease-like cell division protein FtsX [Streptosporangium sp. LJ11]|uniref:permease-like cell division protein FtsX n=1 Tax=Streptosporangium sp. LJ11 TaxID=3436927 RepID=UPI003F790951
MRVNSDRPPDRALPDLVLPASFLADDVGDAGDLAEGAVPGEPAVASDADVIRLSLRDPEFRPVPRLVVAVVAATVVAGAVTTTVIARGSGEDRPLTLAAMGALVPEWHDGDPEIVVFFCEDDSPFVSCGGGGFPEDDGGSGPPPDPILGGEAATPRDKAVVERTLGAMPQVEAISFVDKREAYAEFRRDEPKLAQRIVEANMTESFTLKMRPGTDWNTVIETAKTLPGVASVFNRKCITENLRKISEGNRGLCAPGGLDS